MYNFKAILAILGIALLPSCLIDDFSALEKDKGGVYVQSDDKGGSEVDNFAVALIPTGGSGGLNYYIVSDALPTVRHVNFDQAGKRDPGADEQIQGASSFSDPPAVASDFSSSANGSVTNVALGIVENGVGKVAIFKGTFGDSSRQLDSINLIGGIAPTGIAFGKTNAAGTDGTDMLVISGAELNIVADYEAKTTQTGNCGLRMGGSVLLADLDATSAGEEVVIGTDGEVFISTAAALETKMNPAADCALAAAPNIQIPTPAGATDFGKVIAAGRFNAGDLIDLVVASPATNNVYVYMDWTVATPTQPIRIGAPSAEPMAFGSSVVVGDFDGDGQDELVIADPKTAVADKTAAGRVYLFSGDGSGGFGTPIVLHDSRAEKGQNFGRSLAAVPGFGTDRLIIGTSKEVFTYFKTPLSGDLDFR